MLNESAVTDARHARSSKDAMLYDENGRPMAQITSFTTKSNHNNYKYNVIGFGREQEVPGTVAVTLQITEIVVKDGDLFSAVLRSIVDGKNDPMIFSGVIEGNNGSEERVMYRECILSGECDIQNVSTGDVLQRNFSLHCNGKVENKSKLTI